MRTKPNGQNLLLIVILVLVFMLSYCAIPSKETMHEPQQAHDTEQMEHAADVHDKADVKEAAHEEHAEVKEEHPAEEAAEAKHEEKAAEPQKQAMEIDPSFPVMIAMEHPDYPKHTKGIAMFSHLKHVQDYGIACGDCHHDSDGTPLADLKMGDSVESCMECHSNPGKAPKEDKDNKVAYHAEMLHENCIGCHKEAKTEAAPTKCGDCHPKK